MRICVYIYICRPILHICALWPMRDLFGTIRTHGVYWGTLAPLGVAHWDYGVLSCRSVGLVVLDNPLPGLCFQLYGLRNKEYEKRSSFLTGWRLQLADGPKAQTFYRYGVSKNKGRE